jgi:hypothetical protein
VQISYIVILLIIVIGIYLIFKPNAPEVKESVIKQEQGVVRPPHQRAQEAVNNLNKKTESTRKQVEDIIKEDSGK